MSEAVTDLLRVLLVEDDEIDAMAALRLMDRSGVDVEVTHEHDAQRGLERAAAEDFDLYVFDLIFPSISRERMLHGLADVGSGKRPLVVRTAAEGVLAPHELVAAGVATFVSKDDDGDEALACILGDLSSERGRAAETQETAGGGEGFSVAPLTTLEGSRLERLDSYLVLDTSPEPLFDRITALAARVCGTPIALVSLVDAERQWFKSRVGLDATETPREMAFCAHAILEPALPMEVRDAEQDERFRANPLVLGPPQVRFYFGIPLLAEDCLPLGTLCAIDSKPRERLSFEQRSAMAELARLTENALRVARDLRAAEQRYSPLGG